MINIELMAEIEKLVRQSVDDRLFTSKELAKRWVCSRRTIARMARTGKLPPVHVGRLTRFRMSDVQKVEAGRGEQ